MSTIPANPPSLVIDSRAKPLPPSDGAPVNAPPSKSRMSDADASRRLTDLVRDYFAPAPIGARTSDRDMAWAYGGAAATNYGRATAKHAQAQYTRLCELERIGSENPRANIKVPGATYPTANGGTTTDANGSRIVSTLRARTENPNRKALTALARKLQP